MNKKIDDYLSKVSNISFDKIDYDYIYRELICYNNINSKDCVKDTLRVFTEMIDNNRGYIKMDEDSLLISNIDNFNNNKRLISLGIFNKLDKVCFNIQNIINYCNKRKINFVGKLNNYDNIGYLEIKLNNIEDSFLLIDYINNKLFKNLYCVNPLFFCVGSVMLSIDSDYSYIEILASYLYRYIVDIKNLNTNNDFNSFKDYILDNYYKLDNQIDMYRYIEFNNKNICLSKFFTSLNENTNLIMYLFSGYDIDKFKEFYNEIDKNKFNKYVDYDNVDDCYELFLELVRVMYLNYGEEYTKNNIYKYVDSGKVDYITRKNSLRKRIMNEKRFNIYLRNIDLDNQVNIIIDNVKLENKKKILEDICKNVFLNYIDRDINYSKIQVARCLIRMSYGDYSSVTRNNNARKMAVENIDKLDVIKLIKMTLAIDYVVSESEYYFLYADYIEKLCC